MLSVFVYNIMEITSLILNFAFWFILIMHF